MLKKATMFSFFVCFIFIISCGDQSLTPTAGTNNSPANIAKEFLRLLSGKTVTVENGDVANWVIEDGGKTIKAIEGITDVFEFDSLKDENTGYYKLEVSANTIHSSIPDKKYYNYYAFGVQNSKLIWYKGYTTNYDERKETFIGKYFNTNTNGSIISPKSGVDTSTLDYAPCFATNKNDVDFSIGNPGIDTIGSLN